MYEITEAGALKFVEWLSDLISAPAKESLQFEAALSLLPGVPPDDAVALLGERCLALEHRIAALRAQLAGAEATGVERLFRIEHEYEVALLEAELEWVRGLIKDIESGSLEGLDLWRGFHPKEDDA